MHGLCIVKYSMCDTHFICDFDGDFALLFILTSLSAFLTAWTCDKQGVNKF
jgi:hypothetical protein